MRAGLLLPCLAYLALAGALPFAVNAQESLEVVKVVLAEPEIEPGGEQLVQISLRNNSGRGVRVGLRVEMLTPDNFRTGGRRQRRVAVPAGAERRYFFRLKAPQSPGEYTVRLVVLNAGFKRHVLAGKPEFISRFVVSGAAAGPRVTVPASAGTTGRKGRPGSFKASGGLKFERPDLLWESFVVEPRKVLIGETMRIRGELRNVGGDIARNIEVRADYVNTRLPTRVFTVSSSTVDLLAPGEKLELEFEHRFPEDALQGDYQFMLTADVGQQVAESDERNNRQTTERPIRLSKILQLFPEADFVFDQAGLFLFRWKSSIYNEFKVQVGTQATFELKSSFFDIPQGQKWTADREVVPLPGELPGMLLGLMVKDGVDKVYWRVVGRVAGTERVGFSRALPFTVNVADETPAAPAPPAQPAGGGSTGGGGRPSKY